MNVYFRHADGSLGKYIVSNVDDHEKAIELVKMELRACDPTAEVRPVLAVIPPASAASQQEAA